MNIQDLRQLHLELSSLSVFRKLLETDTLQALLRMLSKESFDAARMADYGAFVYSLANDNYSFSSFLCRAIYTDENRYVINAAQKVESPAVLQANAHRELQFFTRLTKLTPQDLWCGEATVNGMVIPEFSNAEVNFEITYHERLERINDFGYGIFANDIMFHVVDHEILPVPVADDICTDDFIGYEYERKQFFDNTLALIEGRPAANVLLFGDAGTGKSSSVKACVNYYASRGLRLIELRKDQLTSLSDVMTEIRNNPLKFILFIDDLSFNKNDDCFSMLKAALEGSASASAANAIIVATSNRRHIVKETFGDREGDDIHRNDTVQELMSLSDRFGLNIYFEKPNKQLFLDIVRNLARKNGITTSDEELALGAERFVLSKGSRSPRAAKQFVDSLL